MKNLIAKIAISTVLVLSVSANTMADSGRYKMHSVKIPEVNQSLTRNQNARKFNFKKFILLLASPLMSPWDIDFPGGYDDPNSDTKG